MTGLRTMQRRKIQLLKLGVVLLVITAVSATGWLNSSAVAQTLVVYPRAEFNNDRRVSYPLALLKLFLEKSGDQYVLQPSAVQMQQSHSLRLLAPIQSDPDRYLMH